MELCCFEWKYQGNKQIMEISMDIYGNINGMNGNIQRHHGDIMRVSYGDVWEYCRRFSRDIKLGEMISYEYHGDIDDILGI